MRAWFRAALIAGCILGTAGACKQGEGDVCQIDDDCEDGLDCNAGTRRCQRPGTAAGPDAGAPDAGS